jgi:hypothetical protein
MLGLIPGAIALSACSSSSSTASPALSPAVTAAPPSAAPAATSGAGSASAVADITADWNTFFSTSTPNSKRVQLLQSGSQFSSALSAFEASPLAGAVTSTVKSVTLTSATEATVKYDLSAMGTPVASGASGTAVLEDGVWKLGDTVFCGLLTEAKSAGIALPVPAACGSAS